MKQYLLLTSALAVLGFSSVAQSACIQTPSCSSLGYTSTSSCEGGLKCPFGNAWYCKFSEIQESTENAEKAKACIPGAVFNSDRTCTEKQEVGKVPIGVVVYADGKGHGQAMALDYVSDSSSGWSVSTLYLSVSSLYLSKYYSFWLFVDYSDIYLFPGSRYEEDFVDHSSRPVKYCFSSSNVFAFNSDKYIPYNSLEEASLDLDSKSGTDKLVNEINTINDEVKTQFEYAKSFNHYLEESVDDNHYPYPPDLWAGGSFDKIKVKSLVDNVRSYKTTSTSAGEWNLPAPAIFNSVKLNFDAIRATYAALGKNFSIDGTMAVGYILDNYEAHELRCPIFFFFFTDTSPFNDKFTQTHTESGTSYGNIVDGVIETASYTNYYMDISVEDAKQLPYTTVKVFAASSSIISRGSDGIFIAFDGSEPPVYIVGKRSNSYGTSTSGSVSSAYPVIDF